MSQLIILQQGMLGYTQGINVPPEEITVKTRIAKLVEQCFPNAFLESFDQVCIPLNRKVIHVASEGFFDSDSLSFKRSESNDLIINHHNQDIIMIPSEEIEGVVLFRDPDGIIDCYEIGRAFSTASHYQLSPGKDWVEINETVLLD